MMRYITTAPILLLLSACGGDDFNGKVRSASDLHDCLETASARVVSALTGTSLDDVVRPAEGYISNSLSDVLWERVEAGDNESQMASFFYGSVEDYMLPFLAACTRSAVSGDRVDWPS